MSSVPARAIADSAARSLRVAWIGAVLVVPAIVLAVFVGDGLLTLQGYESGSEERVPLGPVLLAAIPATLIVLLPASVAVWFGLRARRGGNRRGWLPALVGGVVGIGFLTTNVLGYLVSS